MIPINNAASVIADQSIGNTTSLVEGLFNPQLVMWIGIAVIIVIGIYLLIFKKW